MPNKRDLKLDQYDIDGDLYRELKYFCRQYRKKKAKAADCYSIGSPKLGGAPHSGGVSDPVADAVSRRMALTKDCAIMEETACKVCPYQWKIFLSTIADSGTWYQAQLRGLKMGRPAFEKARREFFYELAKALGKI